MVRKEPFAQGEVGAVRLKDYAGFRKLIDLYDLRYKIDIYSNTYIVTDREGNELIALDGYDVRNNFHKVRDKLVTAVTMHGIFGE